MPDFKPPPCFFPIRNLQAGEDCWISDVELRSERQDDAVRNVGGIGQERAQKPNRTELEGKPQACMVVTTPTGCATRFTTSKLYCINERHKPFHHSCQFACSFLGLAPRQKDDNLSKTGPEPVHWEVHLVEHPVGNSMPV